MGPTQKSMAKPPKTMSSRLATMKFMQRATAMKTSVTSSSTGDEPSAKRQRLSASPPASSTPVVPMRTEVDSEELRRADALERHAERVGETRWVLSFQDESKDGVNPGALDGPKQFEIIHAGYAIIDESSNRDDGRDEKRGKLAGRTGTGRMNFGGFKRDIKASKEDVSDPPSPSSGEISGPEDTSYEPLDASSLIEDARRQATRRSKTEHKVQRHSEKGKIQKPVKLHKLTSLSGTLAGKTNSTMQCYKCGGRGHPARNCPKQNRRG